jgi:hypothetical protein
MKRTALILAVFVSLLVLAAVADAHTHHRHAAHHARHHATHHRQVAHRASVCEGCEYFPVLEEWLTPDEAREVREFEAKLPGLVAEAEAEAEASYYY